MNIKNKIKYRIKRIYRTINSICLCIRFPFLYTRNRFTGLHYNNWKINDKLKQLVKEAYTFGGHENGYKSIVKNSKKYDMDTISEYCIGHDTIGKNNVYFTVRVGNEEETFETMIIPVNLTTGKIGNAVKTIKGYIYNLAYDNGYVDGKEEGHRQGYEEGYSKGYRRGLADAIACEDKLT